MLNYVHFLFLSLLFAVTVYSIYAGSRPFLYFVVVSALFVTSVLIGKTSSDESRNILFLTAIILAISVSSSIIIGNGFYPFNTFGREPILQTGSLVAYQNDAVTAGLYYYIPIDTITSASLALVTGQTIIVPFLVSSSILLGVVAGIFSLLWRLTRNNLTAIIGVFFIMSIPSLSFLGRLFGLIYGIFYILFILLLYKAPVASIAGLFIISLPLVFAHPSGFIAVFALLVPLALLGVKDWPTMGVSARRIRLCLLTTTVIAFAYWTYTYLLSLLTRQGEKFYLSITSYFSGVTSGGTAGNYVPLYYSSENGFFAYVWAVPAALSAAFLLCTILQTIRHKKFDRTESLTVASAFVGLSLILTSYLSYPRVETGQYIIPVGYFLLVISSSVAASRLLSFNLKKYFGIVAALLALFVLIGTYSPDWAPLEHQNFEQAATIHPFHVYLEAGTVTQLVAGNSTVYYDYDFPIGSGNYKPIRETILQVSSGADPTEFAKLPVTLYGIKEDRFSSQDSLNQWDTVYSSGYHRVIIVDQTHLASSNSSYTGSDNP
jgi:hypothetical protein